IRFGQPGLTRVAPKLGVIRAIVAAPRTLASAITCAVCGDGSRFAFIAFLINERPPHGWTGRKRVHRFIAILLSNDTQQQVLPCAFLAWFFMWWWFEMFSSSVA
ncbi:hypothetical protein KC19_7G017000, partial [Ceratodon purpureus]